MRAPIRRAGPLLPGRLVPAGLLIACAAAALSAAVVPEAEITNGLVKARIYLPDSRYGFYRGTRFDWSGVVASLESQGHTYFGPWFKAHDPEVRDIEYRADLDGFAAGTPSAALGPVEEFANPLGFDEAPAGGTFVKIGVGVLRKPDAARYAWSTRYEILDPGTWNVRRGRDRVEFVQVVERPPGFSYRYRKTVRLSKDKAELVLEHSLRNTGTRTIDTPVYAHNFLVMDDLPSGPDVLIKVPFDIQAARDKSGALETRGRELAFTRELVNDERAMVAVAGFGSDAKDYDIRVENRRSGAGVRITADRPLARLTVWAIRPTRCPEPFIAVKVEPGREFTWRIAYEFYTLSTSRPAR
jgi:hypothetical protein